MSLNHDFKTMIEIIPMYGVSYMVQNFLHQFHLIFGWLSEILVRAGFVCVVIKEIIVP